MTSRWTPDEDAHLVAHASTRTAEQLGADLGRTPVGVYERAKRLRVQLRSHEKHLRSFEHKTNHPRREALLLAIADGPSTTAELAATVGSTVRLTFAAMQRLKATGRVERSPMPTGNRSRLYLWSLPK